MSQLSARAGVALAATLAVVLVGLAPLLGASTAFAPDLVMLSLALLAVAAMAGTACLCGALGVRQVTAAPVRDEPAPVLRGRATDPVHHPLAPRAPGTA